MVNNINLLHYLSESTYKKICGRLGLSETNPSTGMGDNYVNFFNQRIYKIHMFNIEYAGFGHVWFMRIHIDFQKFSCSYNEFKKQLYMSYHKLFGPDIMSDFPVFEHLNCDYIEYTGVIEVGNADSEIERLKNDKCVPEQLDRGLWDKYSKAHGTIEFCIGRLDETHLQTLARCHGTALKKRIKDSSLHRATGVMPAVAVNAETEKEIMGWLYSKHGFSGAVPS